MYKTIIAVLLITASASVLADPPKIYSQDGKYLGTLSNNKFDPDSVSNQFGRYGSKFSPDSINNKFGTYGSPYSNQSVRNPYATQAPQIIHHDD